MYYKISTNIGGFISYQYLEAESKEQAQEALAEMIHNLKNGTDEPVGGEELQSSIREVNIDECIAEEKKTHARDIARLYVRLHYDIYSITVGEFSRLQDAMSHDAHTKWLMLKDQNCLNRQYNFLEKVCDLEKMPTAFYKEAAKKLLLAADTSEYEDIAIEICRQYGKEQFRRQAEEDKTCPFTSENNVIL